MILPSTETNRPHTIWLQKRDGRYVLALLQQPQVRPVMWALGVPKPKIYYLATPFVVYVIGMGIDTLASVFVYYANSAPREAGDNLSHTNLPNIFVNDRACLGFDDTLQSLQRELAPLGLPHERARHVIRFYWNGIFTDHIPEHFYDLGRSDSRYRTIDDWASLSRRDSEAVLTTNWHYACSLQESLRRCWQTFE